MARDFSGTAQYLTFADVAAHDWSLPWTVAAIVYTDTVAAGDKHIVFHGNTGGAFAGWRFALNAANLNFVAIGQWGAPGTATTELSTGTWYGVACTKAAASTLVTYYRYVLSTSTFASETVETFANGYTDGTSYGRIGCQTADGVGFAELWDGRMARVAFFGQALTQAELAQVFRGTNTFPSTVKAWWEISGTADPEIDHGSGAAHATNVSTTFVDNPTDIGTPFGVISPVIAMQRQGGQMIGRRYV